MIVSRDLADIAFSVCYVMFVENIYVKDDRCYLVLSPLREVQA